MKIPLIEGKAVEYINDGNVYSVKVKNVGFYIHPNTGEGYLVIEGTTLQGSGDVRLVVRSTSRNNLTVIGVIGNGNLIPFRLEGVVIHVLFGRKSSGEEFVRFYLDGVDGYVGEVEN